ncbi:uncharacterized protein C1orf198 homolog isoform X2 [Genypterus blacodes]|uniref:uncharacterized protein C1orf198 homolog isoform X2 n=1 Tax=Genypterus blacodes TaxID=154954 RepID=UPI003F76FB8D
MAAATVVGLEPHRMEEKKFEYFSSINSMARKIMQERETIKVKHGPAWEKMSAQEQDSAIDNGMMEPHIRARYAMHRVDREEMVCYPKLLLQTGQKIVHFGEEDITWQDEHSAPFSWETKSQIEFTLTVSSVDQSLPAQTESKALKVPNPSQLAKTAPANKVTISEGRRTEEESSFWKISAERSRLEGEQAQSLTPSQIKSLEKGEKSLPSYLRQESSVINAPSKEPEAVDCPPLPAPVKFNKQRTPRPPAPQPPTPVTVTVAATPASISSSSPTPPISVSSTVAGWERSQSTLPSVSNTMEEMFPSVVLDVPKPSNPPAGQERQRVAEAPPTSDMDAFAKFNTSNNILKTGFDFLDNW